MLLLVGLGHQNLQEGWRSRLRAGWEKSSSEKLESESPRNDLQAEMV